MQRQNECVKVCVRDYGAGIPEQSFEQIFEKFFRLDGSDTRDKEGTGLGLSISKSIIELHGGEIGVESEVGVGSTFFFSLPTVD